MKYILPIILLATIVSTPAKTESNSEMHMRWRQASLDHTVKQAKELIGNIGDKSNGIFAGLMIYKAPISEHTPREAIVCGMVSHPNEEGDYMAYEKFIFNLYKEKYFIVETEGQEFLWKTWCRSYLGVEPLMVLENDKGNIYFSSTPSDTPKEIVKKVEQDARERVEKGKAAIAELSGEPESAKFRKLKIYSNFPFKDPGFNPTTIGATTLCGEVNMKNKQGEYEGYQKFYHNSTSEKSSEFLYEVFCKVHNINEGEIMSISPQ
jgi:hypothetical protein